MQMQVYVSRHNEDPYMYMVLEPKIYVKTRKQHCTEITKTASQMTGTIHDKSTVPGQICQRGQQPR